MTGQRFANLDAMRGVCALSVVLFHCSGLFVADEIFCHGYLAVDMFFVLSGFVIAHSYEGRLTGSLSAEDFARARIRRLGPVFWTGTLAGIGMMILVAHFQPPGMFYSAAQIAGLSLMALVLVPQITMPAFGGSAYPVNAVAWSLMGELVANLLYARFMVRWSTRALLMVVICGWAGCAAIAYLNPSGWCFGATASTVLLTPLRAVPSFIMGVVLYRWWRVDGFARVPQVTPLLPLLIWLAIAEVPTFGATPTFDLLVVTIACPLLLVFIMRAPQSVPGPLLWLGAISYPLYASHLAVVFTARSTPLFGLEDAPAPLRASLMILVCLGLAWAIHRLVEQPRGETPLRRLFKV